MRILHFTGEFPPHVSGGLATYVYEVTTRLANVGHTVDVALVKGDSDYYRSVEPVDGDVDLSVIDFDPEEIDALSATMLDIDAVQAAVGNVDLGTTDLVHVHDWYGVFGALAATADSNVPIIVSSHLPLRSGYMYSGHSVSRQAKLDIEALGFRIADRIVAPSEFVKQIIQREYDVNADQVEVLSNGVDTTRFTPGTDRSDRRGPIEITTVARLTEQKGIPYLLEAAADLPNTLDVAVSIVGEGPRRNALEKERDALGVSETVTFEGFLPEPGLTDAYLDSDIFAFPSVYEPFGLVVLEAMASGRPVVAFDAGGVAEIVRDGIDGLLVPPGDVTAFANALEALATDHERRRAMGRNARNRAEDFEWARCVSGLEEIYKKRAAVAVA